MLYATRRTQHHTNRVVEEEIRPRVLVLETHGRIPPPETVAMALALHNPVVAFREEPAC